MPASSQWAILSSDNRGPPLSHSNCCSLRLEPQLVPPLSDHWQGTRRPPWHHFASCRSLRTLLRAPRTLSRPAHRSISRPLWLTLALRLAPRADLSRPRGLSPTTLRRRVRRSSRHHIFPIFTLSACRANRRNTCDGNRLRVPRHAQHSRLRRLRPLLRLEHHLPCRTAPSPHPQNGRRHLAIAAARTPGTHEPKQRHRRPRHHRHRHRARLSGGRSSAGHRPLLRPKISRHHSRARSLRSVSLPRAFGRVARRSRLKTLRLQFFARDFQFHGRKSFLLAFAPVFLREPSRNYGDRSRRPEPSHSAR